MMEKIRLAANNIVVKIIFGIIILAFIFTGVGGFLGFGSDSNDEQLYITKIDGQGISRAAFEREAQIATQNAGSLGGDDSFIRSIRRSVLANQIDNYLSYQLSESLNAAISDEHIKKIIRQQPIFFENGRFSNKLYLELLAANNYTPDAYAEALRGSILQQQVMGSLLTSEFLLPSDLDIITLEKQQRTGYIASVSLEDIIEPNTINISDEQALAYYEENESTFFRKERVKVEYIRLVKSDFESALLGKDISDKDVEAYYKSHKQNYVEPLRHSYSFIELDDKQTAEEILIQLKNGADFNAIAKEYSLYPNMSNMGWFAINDKSRLPQVIVAANLSKKGQLSSLIEDNDHYIILRLDNIEKEQQYPFSIVKEMVRADLWRQTVDKNYEDTLKRLESSVNKGFDTVTKIAEDAKLTDKVYESEWSYYQEGLSILRIPLIRDIIFDGTMFDDKGSTGKITDIVYSNHDNAHYVLKVVDYKPEGILKFEEEKQNIIDRLTKTAMKEMFSDRIVAITDSLNQGERLNNIRFAQRYTLTRESDDLDKRTVDMIFSLVPPAESEGTIYGSNILSDSTANIAVLLGVMQPDIEQSMIDDAINNIRSSVSNNTNYYLSSALRSKVKIEIMPNANL